MNAKIKIRLNWLGTLLLVSHAAVSFAASPPNTLTDAERQAGWKLLFDGKTTTGWRGYKMEKMPPGWSVIDGVLTRVKGGAGGKGAGGGDDIVTTEEFENFDLQLEWKTVPSGNSGVLYHVSEEPVAAWHYAPEVQILDNTAHPTRSKLELAAACYDLYAPTKDMTKPLGQWNQMRILVDGAHVEHWLNGEIRVVGRRLEATRRKEQTQRPSEIRYVQKGTDCSARPHRPPRVPQHQDSRVAGKGSEVT